MELTNEFSVGVPVDEAWALLTDLERIAPCMPGCELREIDGDEYRGVVKVKVGPMIAQYEGVASFQERDAARRRAVVRAQGRDSRGRGNASATVTATLEPTDGGTHVRLHTDLRISGRVAQFGRSVLSDVSSKLLADFVRALEADVQSGAAVAGGEATRAGGDAATAGPTPVAPTAREPVDLLTRAGPSLIRRVGPLVAVLALGLAVVLWLLG